MIEITVNRNGAKNKMQMAREFAKHPNFHLYRISEIIETMRSYERAGQLVVTDETLTIIHYC